MDAFPKLGRSWSWTCLEPGVGRGAVDERELSIFWDRRRRRDSGQSTARSRSIEFGNSACTFARVTCSRGVGSSPSACAIITLSKESISCRVSLCHRVHTVSRHHAPQAATRQSDPHIPPDRGADSPWHRGGASEGRRRAAFRAHPGVAAAHQPKYRREGLSRTGARWVGWPWAPLRSLCWPWEPR